ncbi:MAG: hypothetical protein ACTSQI_22630, partial [Candidatus Helarchaeota archaeon]
MNEVGILISGVKSQNIYYAVCKDAVKEKSIVCIIAERKEIIIGFVIAAINWKHYWINFSLRHPIIAIQIIRKRLIRRLKKIRQQNISAPKNKDLNKILDNLNTSNPSGRN